MDIERLRAETPEHPFPIYADIVTRLLSAHAKQERTTRDVTVAHILGTCSGYSAADLPTVAMIASRLGPCPPASPEERATEDYDPEAHKAYRYIAALRPTGVVTEFGDYDN